MGEIVSWITQKTQLQVHFRTFCLILLPGTEQVGEEKAESELLALALNAWRNGVLWRTYEVSWAPKNCLWLAWGGRELAKLCLWVSASDPFSSLWNLSHLTQGQIRGETITRNPAFVFPICWCFLVPELNMCSLNALINLQLVGKPANHTTGREIKLLCTQPQIILHIIKQNTVVGLF